MKIITWVSLVLLTAGCGSQTIPAEYIYVGTAGNQEDSGLYVFGFDRENNELNPIQTIDDHSGPNFQALHPDGTFLYSVSGEAFSDDDESGTLTAYRIDQNTGKLSMVNEQSAEGRGPCHVSVDPLGRFVYVSNYSSGNLSVYAINGDGTLEPAADRVQHEGSSIHASRQKGPYMHSIIPSADGKFIYASDLGMDKVMIYTVNRTSGKLAPADIPYAENTPGSGPRHFVIHPGGRFAYSVEELSSTVAAFKMDPSNGSLEAIQRIPMLPEDFEGANTAADIHISPDGKFLYASNRGHDSLVIYSIEASTGRLSLVGHEPSRGRHPRNFAVDKKGDLIFISNRDDDNVVVFNRDKITGLLSFSGLEINVPSAICVTQLILE